MCEPGKPCPNMEEAAVEGPGPEDLLPCFYCKKVPGDGYITRPFGPNGEPVCYNCSEINPEQAGRTRAAIEKSLEKRGVHVIEIDASELANILLATLRRAKARMDAEHAEKEQQELDESMRQGQQPV